VPANRFRQGSPRPRRHLAPETEHDPEGTARRGQPVLQLIWVGRRGRLKVEVERAVGVVVQIGAVVEDVALDRVGTKNMLESYIVNDQNPYTGGGTMLAGRCAT